MSKLNRVDDKSNEVYQKKLNEANNLLYSLVADMQSSGKSIRDIARHLRVSRSDILKILHKDAGKLAYSCILRIQSFYNQNR